ncbi:hypothetical protein GCM10009700_13500 [Brevibacterium sanguinis]
MTGPVPVGLLTTLGSTSRNRYSRVVDIHVVKLAGDILDDVRRRVQQETTGHRGRAKDPLYRARRTLHPGVDLLTTKQQERIASLFADASFTEVEVTWAVY